MNKREDGYSYLAATMSKDRILFSVRTFEAYYLANRNLRNTSYYLVQQSSGCLRRGALDFKL